MADVKKAGAFTKIVAYEMKTKTKGVEMLQAVITKTTKGVFMAQGVSKAGNKMTTMLSEANALAAVKGGFAKKGW